MPGPSLTQQDAAGHSALFHLKLHKNKIRKGSIYTHLHAIKESSWIKAIFSQEDLSPNITLLFT